MRYAATFLVFACLLFGCSEPVPPAHDLIITNATILNTLTGKTEAHRTIVIDSGIITAVLENAPDLSADSVFDAQDKLVVPGFIDAVGHLDDIFGDRPDTLKTSVPDCVKKFSETYLPYGVTTVRNSGDGTGYYAIADYLFQSEDPGVPDFYFAGGSLAGWYEGPPYINHLLVADSSEAEYWVTSMYNTGSVKYIKLYCNGAMNYEVYTAALRKAMSYEMIVTSQVQGQITIDSALSLGVRNFEHASTICYQPNVFRIFEDEPFNDTIAKYWNDQEEGSRIYRFLEAANYVGMENPEITATIKNMAAHHATMTTSLHFFAQWLKRTWFCSEPKASRFDCSGFTAMQQERCNRGYNILASYVRSMYENGVTLTMGSDHRDGGKAVLSEILLLHEIGIPMENCIQIATINTARAIGLESMYGSIEPGKRANLIVFGENPLDNPDALLMEMSVLKDGVFYQHK